MVLWSRVLEPRVDKWCCGLGFFEPRFEIFKYKKPAMWSHALEFNFYTIINL